MRFLQYIEITLWQRLRERKRWENCILFYDRRWHFFLSLSLDILRAAVCVQVHVIAVNEWNCKRNVYVSLLRRQAHASISSELTVTRKSNKNHEEVKSWCQRSTDNLLGRWPIIIGHSRISILPPGGDWTDGRSHISNDRTRLRRYES